MPASAPVFIGEETATPTPVPKEVVVMEDDASMRQYVVDALRHIGLNSRTVSDAKEAVDLAKNKVCHYYILDVNMGKSRGQEGLDALEKIKKFDPNSFVAVYSTHRDKLQKAIKLGADVSKEKSENQIKDMTSIILQMMVSRFGDRVEEFLRSVLGQESQGGSNHNNPAHIDENIEAYNVYVSDSEWLTSHLGKYVAFVNGTLVAEDDDRKSLLKKVRKKYPGTRALVTRVRGEKEVVQILTPQIFTK